MAKITLKKNITHKGAIHKTGTTIEVDSDIADSLIDREFATKAGKEIPAAGDKDAAVARAALVKQFKKASKDDLLKAKADAEEVFGKDPSRLDAQVAIEVFTELLEGK